MKEKLTRNIGLKILSVILAALLWLVITNVDNPVETKTFWDVPVVIKNEAVIASLDRGYEIIEGETIDFAVSARRSIKDNLTEADFNVTADFAHLSDANSVYIDITPKRNIDDIIITEGRYQPMKISLEELIEANFKVNIRSKGEVAEGFFVGEKTASPNIITVSGPKSRVERISEVAVDVVVSNKSVSFQKDIEPKAYDMDGELIDSSKLEFSEKYVTVDMELNKTKTINIAFTVTGNPAYGYTYTDEEYEPKTIVVSGSDEALKKIHNLSITESILGKSESVEDEINLQDELPEGITLVGEDKTAVINITIEKNETKDIDIWPKDIEIRNIPETLEVEFNTSGPITIQVMGTKDVLANSSRSTLKPYIDVTDYTTGNFTMAVKFDTKEMTILNSPSVQFDLKKEER